MAFTGRPMRTFQVTPEQSAHLLNLLSDNPRTWNAELRRQLKQVVSDTEAYNARLEQTGRA